ncbi:Erythroid differentiation-related factor 1 [Phytophthora cinnamomi]|uniref:Erythroid differentiation-related factor 1 n=1 Tax=Phytophthora cinnamomi TaxID=4785 RepID=UPI0035594DD9|nr:Erythroid differentiation-related factor 1 [Phytophthora cinnamomi]
MELDEEQRGVASFSLPASPTGSEPVSVWAEDARVPSAAPDFPLVLWESSSSSSSEQPELPRTSSAIVPFQKLRLDTNLHQTTLPYRLQDGSPRSSASSASLGSPGSSAGSDSPAGSRKSAAQRFLGLETDSQARTAQMSQDFMDALRLGDLKAPQDEPQLSVRLRGSRVELASASEEQQVDFLGPAENIKRLFKLPYSQSRVSLAVHRVGSTLVVDGELDENDLPAGFEDLPQDTLQLAQQSDETTQRLLYEKFIYESTVKSQLPPSESEVVGGQDEIVTQKPKVKKQGRKSKKAKKAKQKAAAGSTEKVGLLPPAELRGGVDSVDVPVPPPSIGGLSSTWAAATGSGTGGGEQDVHVTATQATSRQPGSAPSNDQQKPPPSFIPTETNWFASAAQHPPAYGDSQTFQRILKWKFNDLKMILGSQVLLFSNQEHPAVSLKLHDMDKELSLCTVLDYYLDNVIANIPELAICLHSKGLVRGYKLVETRQIPYMSGSGRPLFDVQDKPLEVHGSLTVLYDIISGVKRNLLSTLRENEAEFLKTFNEETETLDLEVLASRGEGLMMLSFLAYLRALSPSADSELYFLLMKKLGNASNELGKYFLATKRDYKEAFRWFDRGCKIFNDIEDGVNVALLRANLAHLHKIFAQGKSADSREEHYRTAIQLCTDALQLLKQSKADVDLHRKVKGELALTYLVWAVDMAGHVSSMGPATHSSLKTHESEALKVFNKAMTLYAELGDQKQVASTHYQIASFYSRMISDTLRIRTESSGASKSEGSSSTLTNRMEIARRHYEKALDYFAAVEVGKTFVLIHQELADLHILGGRVEGVEHALLILLNTYEAFDRASASDSKLEREEMAALARDIVAKVKTVLHQLIRLSSGTRSNNVHTKTKKLEMFKKMYKEVIYYDGYSAGSIVPILGTLRGMYTQ